MTTDQQSESDLDASLTEAARLTSNDEPQEALDLLLGIEPSHPDDPRLLCMIGALAGNVGAEGVAVDFFRRCLAQNPRESELLIAAGAGLAAVGDPGAEPALRLAALTYPHIPAARMHYGIVLVRSGMFTEGFDELVAAREMEPDDPEIRLHLGIGYLLAARVDEALAELESAYLAGSDRPEIKVLWGLAMMSNGRVAAAAEELYPLAGEMDDDAELQLILALAFASEGWEEQAWLALSRAEGAASPADSAALREVEEAIEAGEDPARELLVENLAPPALRDRLLLI